MHQRAAKPRPTTSRKEAKRWTHKWSRNKWICSLTAGLAAALLASPAHAQTVAVVEGSSWVSATIMSVSTVFALWIAAIVVSGFARKMRWLTPHRHSRLSRGFQVVFGGLLLMAILLPYLVLNHPVVAAVLVVTALCMTLLVTSRNRQFSGESN